jgi:hypothetical protein
MLKSGAMILSIWCLLNILPGVGSLLFIFLGNHAPALRMLFTVEEIRTLDARALAVADGLAILVNTLIAVYCGLVFHVIRKCLLKRERWSFFVLAAGILILQAAGYISDRFFLGKNFLVLNISSLVLLAGFGLCARELFTRTIHSKTR